ncbi:unnamed protein product [Kuraishia capsulata CBS 1993]|uniref:Uncharacterized protein n=1 Tax=Kuraishia capsulata CBS 1993 TaxID=1382522 RepID=W6MVF0_9ASCO|nr:uncharacterized protein KUCA_T00005916001 [Kuraishia capsulata CBS 1993]CDK29922.1 unnamed protein product [Kuraishia capsulata CBS 1993]
MATHQFEKKLICVQPQDLPSPNWIRETQKGADDDGPVLRFDEEILTFKFTMHDLIIKIGD